MSSKRKRVNDNDLEVDSSKRSKQITSEEIDDSSVSIDENQEEYQNPSVNENLPFTQNFSIPQINKLIDIHSFKVIVMKTRQYDNALIEKYNDVDQDFE